jgi:CubicO group peptidase (beta-lactamase class C family)
VAAERIAANAEMPFAEYLRRAVLDPLGMKAVLRGSPGAGLHGSLDDLALLGRELLSPTLIALETLAEATSVQFPGLAGVIPDLGRFDPNDWGLGFELKGTKRPHFSGTLTSPRTFGHWGGSGTFIWIDPDRDLALGVLTDLEFGDWAKEAWPRLSDAVVREQA